MPPLRWMVALLALAALKVLRCWALVLGLAALAGLGPALAALLVVLLLNLDLLLRVLAAYGALVAWHWPWWLALLLAFPRLPLQLPGVISLRLARWRHPPPRWTEADVRVLPSLR